MGMLRIPWTVLGIVAALGTGSWPARAEGVPVQEATAAQKKEAQEAFVEAKKHFGEKRFEEALAGFRKSYDAVASPNSHLMIGRTLRELDRIVEAYETFGRVAEEAEAAAEKSPKYGKAAEAARKERNDLQPRVAFVSLKIVGATEDTEVLINDVPLERDRWSERIPVRVGVITVSAKAPGEAEYTTDVTVAGGTVTHEVDLAELWATPEPAPAPPPVEEKQPDASVDLLGLDTRTWAYIAGGVGAAGAVTFGVFGAMNRSKYNSLESDCPGGVCPTDRSDDIDAGKRYQTIANVGLVVGVVGLGTGTVLYLLSDDDKGREQTSAQVGVGPGSVMVKGSF